MKPSISTSAPANTPTTPAQQKPRTDHNAEWDAGRDAESDGDRDADEVHHTAADIRDRGLLDSLGRAVTAPVKPEREPAIPQRQPGERP